MSVFAYPAFARVRGCTRLCVKNYGAVGNGSHDDTAAFAAAIAALPQDGGEIHVPAGTYMIDTGKYVRLRSNMLLNLDTGAVLKAKTNSLARDYIVLIQGCDNVEIAGDGMILGDADTFVPQVGTTSEWGHGIQILGSTNVTVQGVKTSRCVGDGICVGGYQGKATSHLRIAGVTSTGNRRQGLSITFADGDIEVLDSEFSNTSGTSPQCGIDIEPEKGEICRGIRIAGCSTTGNARYGINVIQRSDGGLISDITLQDNLVADNLSCGIVVFGGTRVHVLGGKIRHNSATGYFDTSSPGSDHVISGVTFFDNYYRLGDKDRVDFTQTGMGPTSVSRDILLRPLTVGGALGSVVGTNTFT